ncbi:MAG: hypothetical protein K5761_04015 [Clostridiales bacterium]|nr:hypothetical protein [Clostridiales bacterium]
MKKLSLIMAFLLAFGILLSSCQKADKKTAADSETTTEEITEPLAEFAGDISSLDELEVIPNLIGREAIFIGGAYFYIVHSGDDINSANYEVDGLYMTSGDFEEAVCITKGYCHSLCMAGGNYIYFYVKYPTGEESIKKVDTSGNTIETIFDDPGDESLSFWNEGLFYVRNGALYLTDFETGEILHKTDEEKGLVQQAFLDMSNGKGIWYSAARPTEAGVDLYYYTPDNDKSEKVTAIGNRFVAAGEKAYYLLSQEGNDLPDDSRDFVYDLMCTDKEGNTNKTGISGKISQELFFYNNYLFYTKYETTDSGIKNRQPYVYDINAGKEYKFVRDELKGRDIRIWDVAGGVLFYSSCETDDEGIGQPKDYCACPLIGGEKPTTLSEVVKTAEKSRAYAAYEASLAAQAERERKESQYGPGSSKLYLEAGSKSTCYKLVRTDGSIEFQILLSPQQSTTKSFPSGRYTLKIAKGDKWISDKEAFGPGGNYDTTNVFYFEDGKSYEITTGSTGNIKNDSQSGFTG